MITGNLTIVMPIRAGRVCVRWVWLGIDSDRRLCCGVAGRPSLVEEGLYGMEKRGGGGVGGEKRRGANESHAVFHRPVTLNLDPLKSVPAGTYLAAKKAPPLKNWYRTRGLPRPACDVR